MCHPCSRGANLGAFVGMHIQPIWRWGSEVAGVLLCDGVPKTGVWTMTQRRCEPTCEDVDGSEMREWKPGVQGGDILGGALMLDCPLLHLLPNRRSRQMNRRCRPTSLLTRSTLPFACGR